MSNHFTFSFISAPLQFICPWDGWIAQGPKIILTLISSSVCSEIRFLHDALAKLQTHLCFLAALFPCANHCCHAVSTSVLVHSDCMNKISSIAQPTKKCALKAQNPKIRNPKIQCLVRQAPSKEDLLPSALYSNIYNMINSDL